MKIALASDLHLEFGEIDLVNSANADVLILSGDILIAQDLHDHPKSKTLPEIEKILGRKQEAAKRYRDFLYRCSVQFPHVIYVAGNHEFYHGKWPLGIDYLRNEVAEYPNINFLEMDTVIINDHVFVGGTIWTDMNNLDPITMNVIRQDMNDFRIIRNSNHDFRKLRPEDVVKQHRETVRYIKRVVSEHQDKKIVVVGHHGPTKQSTHPRYQDDYHLNGAYSSDLTQLILDHPQIKLWTAGHTHHVHRYYVGDTLVACNPRGYIGYEQCAQDFKLRYINLDHMPEKFQGVDWDWDS
jgi:predicted phosphodiesterase